MLPVPRGARAAFRLRFIRARGPLIRDISRDTWTRIEVRVHEIWMAAEIISEEHRAFPI